jgi:hypothetical protein
VFGVAGRCLGEMRLSGNVGTFRLGEFRSGVYLFKVDGMNSLAWKGVVVR